MNTFSRAEKSSMSTQCNKILSYLDFHGTTTWFRSLFVPVHIPDWSVTMMSCLQWRRFPQEPNDSTCLLLVVIASVSRQRDVSVSKQMKMWAFFLRGLWEHLPSIEKWGWRQPASPPHCTPAVHITKAGIHVAGISLCVVGVSLCCRCFIVCCKCFTVCCRCFTVCFRCFTVCCMCFIVCCRCFTVCCRCFTVCFRCFIVCCRLFHCVL